VISCRAETVSSHPVSGAPMPSPNAGARALLKARGDTRTMNRKYLYSFEGSDGTWVPVGECKTDAMALALLAKKVGGKYTLLGDGEPAYLMKKSIDGQEHARIAIYRA
jgi:hypothetical protein